jgi:4'-phosphopantetheinyl transferase
MSPNVAYIWCQDTQTLDPVAVRRAEAGLSAEERARCDRFRLPRDRRDYAIAHELLRRSLDSVERHDGPLSSSLSHTRGFVACAIAPGLPIGVDAERIDPSMAIDELADRHLTPIERAALRRCPHHDRSRLFVELWTLREAFVKATGRGLAEELQNVAFEIDPAGSIGFTPPAAVAGSTWHFGLFAPSDSTRLAVAVCSGVTAAPHLIARHAVAGEPAILRIA